jgi:hypothetical protein
VRTGRGSGAAVSTSAPHEASSTASAVAVQGKQYAVFTWQGLSDTT